MQYNRRNFLKTAGLFTGGLAACSFITKAMTNTGTSFNDLKTFGLQLWTIQDAMGKDAKDSLRQVSTFGYKQIESFEGPKGMFWGMSNIEFKKYMDDLGMTIISSHCDINNTEAFEKKAAEASAIGMKYLICPWIGPQKTADDYKAAADKFNRCGEICKKNNLRFAYHNHAYSFTPMSDGSFPQDIFMKNTDATLVDYEMDIYWVVAAGQDPVEWIEKYPNRFRLGHIKDRKKDTAPKDQDASCDLGKGSIDFKKIAKLASKNGMQYYIVEQEQFENETTLQAAEKDAKYMKELDV